jgi:hypothetical protein
LGSVGINKIWFVKGSLANWYPMGMGPAGDGIWWVDIQGLCPPMPPGLGPGSGLAEGGAPEVGAKRLEATGEDPGTHPVGEVNGGQLGGIEVPGWVPGCLWRPMAIPTGMLDPLVGGPSFDLVPGSCVFLEGGKVLPLGLLIKDAADFITDVVLLVVVTWDDVRVFELEVLTKLVVVTVCLAILSILWARHLIILL